MLRHLVHELSHENGAALFDIKKHSEQIEYIKQYIADRNISIINRLNSGMADESENIKKEIDTFLSDWQRMAENYDENQFYYGEKFMVKSPDEGQGRLMKVFNSNQHDQAFDTMTSMRNVDSMISGNVLIWGD